MAVLINTNKLDHAYRYAEDIKSGKILACKWIKLAVDRFYDDLKHGPQRGIIFDEDAASTRLKAFDFINIKKNITIKSRTGREIRKAQYEPFMLEGWQSWISANEYGFYYDTGERRFNTSIKCMARKNGKTTFGSAEGIIALLFDGEIEAQVYCAATKKDQARILFKEAKKMINISPLLKQFFEKENLTKDSIYDPTTDSYFQPVSSDSNTLDGLNPHKVLLDELHEYKDSGLYDVFVSGMGERLHPHLSMLTTAGFHKDYFFYIFLQNCLQILEGTIKDDSIFVAYYTQDSEEEIKDPKSWIKSNPNLDISINSRFIEREVQSMLNIPSKRTGVLTKTFNMFVDSSETWIESEHWNSLYKSTAWLETQSVEAVYAGFDFAAAKDMYAITFLYILSSGDWYLRHRFYTPGITMGNKYTGTNAQLYAQWEAEGWLHTTPGKTIDSTFIEPWIIESYTTENITFGGYDPYKGTEIVKRLLEELGSDHVYDPEKSKLVEVPRLMPIKQTITNLSEATCKFEEMVTSSKLYHDGSPVMAWHLANVDIIYDSNLNVKPDRKNPNKKIDGVYSTLNAIKTFLTIPKDENPEFIHFRK